MKFLFPKIPWDNIKAIGFDMDGTLYDEFEFIAQVYEPISELICKESNCKHQEIKDFMLWRWLEKGSSYPFIFSETIDRFCADKESKDELIKKSLAIFRNFEPEISLSVRMETILNYCMQYELFLVSDGSSVLQHNKFRSLRLHRFFDKENIFISGDYGKESEKPSLVSLEYLQFYSKGINKNEIVFFGDREQDRLFAEGAGFHFVKIGDSKLY